ncbi:hypothetical protein GC087_25550 (plasmid) [Pantoea sp. JZ2]|uniref:hypothetical protein n=1 Tax=Pantoea sp. JZ2 TaxID=2654189 RepID=UPI002B47EE6C|nr:hypothetical protein [Pantoea sp. JZ2]WRH15934.1 hypothetical protein GC087_25550 [Pantoea sp. JZ2]
MPYELRVLNAKNNEWIKRLDQKQSSLQEKKKLNTLIINQGANSTNSDKKNFAKTILSVLALMNNITPSNASLAAPQTYRDREYYNNSDGKKNLYSAEGEVFQSYKNPTQVKDKNQFISSSITDQIINKIESIKSKDIYSGESHARLRRHVLPSITTTTEPTPKDDSVVAEKIDLSCIDRRNNLSIADMFRQIGNTLKNPVSELAKESQVIHYYNKFNRCPSEKELNRIIKVTTIVDGVISTITSLMPESAPLLIVQRVGGPLFKMIADQIDNKDLDMNNFEELNESAINLGKMMVDKVLKSTHLTDDTELDIPKGIILEKNKIFVDIHHVKREVKYIDNKAMANYDGKYREIAYNRESNKWYKVIKSKPVSAILPGKETPESVFFIGIKNGLPTYKRVNSDTGRAYGKGYTFFESNGQWRVNHKSNKISGVNNFELIKSQPLNSKDITLHRSGLFTTLDSGGKKTGDLILMHNRKGYPVTELSQDKYYMMQEGDNVLILENEIKNDKFNVIKNDLVDNIEEEDYFDNSWCLPKIGRKILVNPGISCSDTPQLLSDSINYRINAQFSKDDIVRDFNVQYKGLNGMDTESRMAVKERIDDTIFFEQQKIVLYQDPIDATNYERIFSNSEIEISENDRFFSDDSDRNIPYTPLLTKNEKLAVRRWTAIDDNLNEAFSDGMPETYAMDIESKNYDLNKKLAHGENLGIDDRNMVRLLDSALNKIPSQKGEYIRVSEYDNLVTPWDNEIKPGDIVTNYPCFMSVSSDQGYLSQSNGLSENTKVSVYLRFEKTESAKPLLKGVASLTNENESLFKRNSAFKVKQIAISNEVTAGNRDGLINKRIVVTLDESNLPESREAKNIHTGNMITVPLLN